VAVNAKTIKARITKIFPLVFIVPPKQPFDRSSQSIRRCCAGLFTFRYINTKNEQIQGKFAGTQAGHPVVYAIHCASSGFATAAETAFKI
jgi:hypothetical protein